MKKHLLIVIALVTLVGSLYSQAQRLAHFENWTATTCPPCASNNPQLRVWVAAHWNALTAVSYHVGWPSPGNDPMYLYNPSESYDRRYYYGVNSVPQGIMQGTHIYIGSPFNWTALSAFYDYYTGTGSPTSVQVTDTRIAGDSIKCNITVTNLSTLPAGTYIMRTMVVERWVVYAVAPYPPLGETVFGNVFRKSLPSVAGTPIPTAAGTYNFEFRYKVVSPPMNDSSIYTMAFIQNDVDKMVLNSGRPGMLVGIEPYINNSPTSFSLQQNYPNPFNPTTNIKFTLPKESSVTLKVYDMLGSEVRTVVDGYHKAGSYNIYFDAANLSSGIYFYTLKTNEFADTKKMILVK
jgi:hypothetical protein